MPTYPECTRVSIPSEGEGKTPIDRAELRRLVVKDHDQNVKPIAMAIMQIAMRPIRSNLDEWNITSSLYLAIQTD
jgi:hypothetical protein